MFVIPAPRDNALPMVTEAMAKAYGNPVTAALVQFFWSGLLGAVLSTIEVPFLLERRTLLWSAVHFLATAAVYSLAGWRCRWFPYVETWLYLLGVLLLLYVLRWSVRFLEWQSDVWAIRKSSGLAAAEPPWRTLAPYLILAAAVELLLPPGLARWWLVYPAACMALTLPCIALIYNSSALFHLWMTGVPGLAGGLLGTVLRRLKKK